MQVPEASWNLYGKADGKEIRECAEVDFVPGEKSEHKDTQPLRYVAIRIRPRQEEFFADGSQVKHFAVVSNMWEWNAERPAAAGGIGRRQGRSKRCMTC